ncbi:MAG: hypothetical protein HXY40_15395 [Chloroflexi bacterium]|nr:hypothetical protein [Chloroflexota bacterium]
MADRSSLQMLGIAMFLVGLLLGFSRLLLPAPFSDWWWLFVLVGLALVVWTWLRRPAGEAAAKPTTEVGRTPSTPAQEVVLTKLVPSSSAGTDSATDMLPVTPQTTDTLGLSAEEMAIQKPDTPETTTTLEDTALEAARRRAEALHAERLQESDPASITKPTRRDLMTPPGGLSVEEMAIQKPTTPATTERFSDDELESALDKARARAEALAATPDFSAEQMASEKPDTEDVTRKIDASMLPPTSTREMARQKPPTEDATHEFKGMEAEPQSDAPPLPAVQDAPMAAEKPETPLSTVETYVEPGALPVDTPLIEQPSPAQQVQEIQATPVELGRPANPQDTLEISTAEIAAEAPLNTDDLTLIEGIGPKISSLLIGHGIGTFSRLADTPEEELREILKRGGLRLAPTLSTWAEQAMLAARGEWEALKALQARLGRRSND